MTREKCSGYDRQFYERQQEGSYLSARHILPLCFELIPIKSVIDIGCGVGTWLRAVEELGVQDYMGVDGDHIDTAMLQIPKDHFMSYNFDSDKPFRLERTFDLVMCLEVAEHLSPRYAESFCRSLTLLGPVILFSAAVPFQGGDYHQNEQWQNYWAEIFSQQAYTVIDCLRPKLWNNPEIRWWYAQNILVFVQNDYLTNMPSLKQEAVKTNTNCLSLVHPANYLRCCDPAYMSLKSLLRLILPCFIKTVRKKLKNNSKIRSDRI